MKCLLHLYLIPVPEYIRFNYKNMALRFSRNAVMLSFWSGMAKVTPNNAASPFAIDSPNKQCQYIKKIV